MQIIGLLKNKKNLLEQSKRNQTRDYLLEKYYDDLKLSDEFKQSMIDVFSKNELDFEKIFIQYNSSDMYKLNTRINYDTIIEIAKRFFSEIDSEYANYFKMRMKDKIGITYGNHPYTNVNSRNIELTSYGDLRDLYTIVHEFSHLFDSKIGDTSTRNILTETVAQSIERLLDSFLMRLDINQLKKYGISKQQLSQDILERRISTFIQRMKSTNDVRKVMPDFGRKAECSGYMLAEIYSTIFSNLGYEEQKIKLKKLIEFISKDEFMKSVNLLGVDLSVNNLNRGKILNFVNRSIVNDCIEINKIKSKETDVKHIK